MTNRLHRFLSESAPQALREERARTEAEAAAQLASRNLAARQILGHAPSRDALCDLCLDMGYIGGFKGRCDDFNQGVIFAANMIADRMADAKPDFIRHLADRAAERLATKGKE